jgi:glycosyltransferase involved in cell wall biosynthesis
MGAARQLERMVVKRANRIVFVAEGNRDDFAAHYGSAAAAKFRVVPNGCDPGEFDAIQPPDIDSSGPHIMLHAGSLYAGRTPAPVFRALAQAFGDGRIDRQRFRLRFLGSNAAAADLAGLTRELGIDDVVEFLPRVPRHVSLRAMVSASSLLLLQPGHTVSVPGKVYEYLAAGRPIFALAEESETAYVVRRSGLGVSVPPDDERAIADALTTVIRLGNSPVTRPPREMYDGNIGAASIETMLREVVSSQIVPQPTSHTNYDKA